MELLMHCAVLGDIHQLTEASKQAGDMETSWQMMTKKKNTTQRML